jgi:hypothetical protein
MSENGREVIGYREIHRSSKWSSSSSPNRFFTKMGPKIGAEGGKIGAQKAKSE